MSTFDTSFEAAATAIFCFILCIGDASSLARVDNNWSHRRSNATVAQNQWSHQQGYRPAFALNRNNQTLGQQQWLLYTNSSSQYKQPIVSVPARPNQTLSNWNQTNYAKNSLTAQGAFNQTRSVWRQQPPYSAANGQNAFNQTRPLPSGPKLPIQTPSSGYGQGTFNQSRPQNSAYGHALYNQSAVLQKPNQHFPNCNQSNTAARNSLTVQSAFNQTRQLPPYSVNGQAAPAWPQHSVPNMPIQTSSSPANSQGYFNQSRPASAQPLPVYISQNPAYGNVQYNQSRSSRPQPSVPQVPQNPAYNQGSLNQSHPACSQPSAPILPHHVQNPASSLYPSLPHNLNSKPAVAPNSWTPPANQTLLYPQLPKQNMSQLQPAGSNNGIPMAPLQPQPNQQDPHNWHSSGQSALSYGPGYYPSAADNLNKAPPKHPVSSNPYANMFI